MADEKAGEFFIQITGDDKLDNRELDAMVRSLQSELADLPIVEDVYQPPAAAPMEKTSPGPKQKGDFVLWGALAIAVLPTVLPKVVEFITEWALRPGNRPIKIKVGTRKNSVEIEFDPRTVKAKDVKQIAKELQALIEG